jgi:type IV pilus assembly protein PilC
MADYRFEGIGVNGKSVQGIIESDTLSNARKRIESLATSRRLSITKIDKRRVFLYKVQKDNERAFIGEQKAFSAEDLAVALEKLGYHTLWIRPKRFSFRMKPPVGDIVTFVRVSADMLREKLPFNEILQLLVNDVENTTLRNSVRQILSDLNQGKDSEEAFVRQESVLGKFTARMLGLASKSGNMVHIYESTATFLERNLEFRKSIRSALIMPMFTLLVLFGAVVFYVAYIFPQTAKLFERMKIELPPVTAGTLKISDFLAVNIFGIISLVLLMIGAAIILFQKPAVRLWIDRMILHIPIIGSLIHKTTIEIFCRVFYSLYSGAGENVNAIRLSAEACGNRYMEQCIKTISIPMMLSKGTGLVEAFEASGVFTKTALARFHSGAETGTIKQSALQLANYYEKETVHKLKNVVDLVQIVIALIIMLVMTGLTLISSETATIRPKGL